MVALAGEELMVYSLLARLSVVRVRVRELRVDLLYRFNALVDDNRKQ